MLRVCLLVIGLGFDCMIFSLLGRLFVCCGLLFRLLGTAWLLGRKLIGLLCDCIDCSIGNCFSLRCLVRLLGYVCILLSYGMINCCFA